MSSTKMELALNGDYASVQKRSRFIFGEKMKFNRIIFGYSKPFGIKTRLRASYFVTEIQF